MHALTADEDAYSDEFEPFDLSEEDDDGKSEFLHNPCMPMTCNMFCASNADMRSMRILSTIIFCPHFCAATRCI